MGLCIGNHYYSEDREFQSIAFGIDFNCVHSSYPWSSYRNINKSTQTLVYSFTVGESVWCLCFYLTYVKHLSVYQYSLFNIQWDTPCLFIFSINAHFSMILLCLLNSNQFRLMDQTTLKRIVVITLFILHSFDCLIIIWTVQQMTLLS